MPPEDRTGVVLLSLVAGLVAVLGAMKGVNERLVLAASEASLSPTLSAVPSGLDSLALLACLVVGSVLLLRTTLRP